MKTIATTHLDPNDWVIRIIIMVKGILGCMDLLYELYVLLVLDWICFYLKLVTFISYINLITIDWQFYLFIST